MNFVLEQPFWIGLLGALFALAISGVWVQVGRKELGLAAIGVLIVTAALVAVGLLVETDHEAVRRTLNSIARDIESNDLDRVLSHVHPQATTIRDQAAAEFPRYRFDAVEIKHNLKIDVRESVGSGQEALATFNVVVTGDLAAGQMASGGFGEQSVPRYCEVTFRQDGDAWRIVDYKHDDPLVGFKKQPGEE